VAFCYSEIPSELEARALVTPNLQVIGQTEAILGGVRGKWKPTEEMPPVFGWTASYPSPISNTCHFTSRAARHRVTTAIRYCGN